MPHQDLLMPWRPVLENAILPPVIFGEIFPLLLKIDNSAGHFQS